MGTIVYLDGVAHVRTTHTLWSEPVRLTHYWPLPSATGIAEEGDSTRSESGGWEVVETRFGVRRFCLPQGGATKAARVDEEPEPVPPTRCETRYRHGRWEKLLKRQGWVAA